jgi:hypothetical protein
MLVISRQKPANFRPTIQASDRNCGCGSIVEQQPSKMARFGVRIEVTEKLLN